MPSLGDGARQGTATSPRTVRLKALRTQIERTMNSADGMDVDYYFIKAQAYLDGWAGHMAATSAAAVNGAAPAYW